MLLNDSITTLSGVGEKRAKLLNKLNIHTVRGLLEYFPRDYEDRSKIKTISELEPDAVNTLRARITAAPENLLINGLTMTKLTITDSTGVLNIIWYNQPYMRKNFSKGKEFYFTGKVIERAGRRQMDSPDYEAAGEGELLSAGRIVPVYRLTAGITQKLLRGLIKDALETFAPQFPEMLPQVFLRSYDLCGRDYAVKNIHFPESGDAFFVARRRLVFEEIFMMQAALLKVKGVLKIKSGFDFSDYNCSPLTDGFAFQFTGAQKRVMDDLFADLKSGMVMNRLVQGDVGSGKTAIAMALSYIAIINGFQAAIMAPTEVLAKQHYEGFSAHFSTLGIETALLTSSIPQDEKKRALDRISRGECKMVVGTHAVIQKAVKFDNLAVVITDEQHRFGVRQRYSLESKGCKPHVLAMSATPIPRTLALILYGDVDISIIDELPPGRQAVDTFCVDSSYHDRIYAFIKKEIAAGRQAYVLCPMIEDGGENVKSLMEYAGHLKSVFEGLEVVMLHGRMKPGEKQDIMDAFSGGVINILVSTTVIEVGINVPNATVMLIENAEKFGLSQLHQLRGRVGRGAHKSYCILITDNKSKVTRERMKAMTKTNDGFEISEMDLKLRGPGDFWGTRQHGLPEFKIANLYTDMEILKLAQEAVQAFSDNADITDDERQRLDDELRLMIGPESGLFAV